MSDDAKERFINELAIALIKEHGLVEEQVADAGAGDESLRSPELPSADWMSRLRASAKKK